MPLTAIFKQPALVRLMQVMALVILPTVAWIDFQQGYTFSAVVELGAAAALISLSLLIRPLGVRLATKLTLVIMFALAALGSLEKLGSTPNFAWFTVMPFLYIAIGGLRLGGVLTLGHFFIIALGYLTIARPALETLTIGTLLQVTLAYFTAAGLALSYAQTQRQLRLRLRRLADHDSLTGLLNRRGMENRLRELSSFLQRHEVVVTLALLDVDHFKRVNDEHGHDVGDRVLQEISRELRRILRSSDYLSRWGGEEFLIALTHTGIHDAAGVLDRLRKEIASISGFSVPSVTLSMGAAEWRPGTALVAALKQVDGALYDAKQRGRNRLVAVAENKTVTTDQLERWFQASPE